MPIYLKPYQADPALTPRIYPLQHMGDYLQERANMARAYAASTPPDCSKAPNCSCCQRQPPNYSWKGPAGITNGKNCSEAEAAYTKAFGKCSAPPGGFTDTSPAVTMKGGKRTGETGPGSKFPELMSRFSPGTSGGEAVKKARENLKKSDSKGKGKGKDKGGDSGSTDSGGDTSGTDTGTTPSTDTAGTPQDLFASIPGLSKFFNDAYQKVCGGSTTKIPFVCTSPAYFEITVIIVIAVVLMLLLGGRRRR